MYKVCVTNKRKKVRIKPYLRFKSKHRYAHVCLKHEFGKVIDTSSDFPVITINKQNLSYDSLIFLWLFVTSFMVR